MKPYELTHQWGIIEIEHGDDSARVYGDLGIQIAEDGRIWLCIDGKALIRFKPVKREEEEAQ